MVWYDPEQAYSSVVGGTEQPEITLARYEGSFFQLRREIDKLMNDLQPPTLIVYVPLDQARYKSRPCRAETQPAWIMRSQGQQPRRASEYQRLAVVARNALRPILGEDTAAQVEKNVDAGKLSLAELNTLLADQGKGAMGAGLPEPLRDGRPLQRR